MISVNSLKADHKIIKGPGYNYYLNGIKVGDGIII
jgi:hypothetical protein